MGRCSSHKTKGKKGHKYLHKQARRATFLSKGVDLIHAEVRKLVDQGAAADSATAVDAYAAAAPQEKDVDRPGLGLHYCLACDRDFKDEAVRLEHTRSKAHKRRVKLLNGPAPHSHLDAELAADRGAPDNGPRLRAGLVPESMLT
eukprot:jgi/Chlat1/2963/Chrsp2S04690